MQTEIPKNKTSILSWPPNERPREKVSKNGAQSVSDAELLAILIRTGSREFSAVDLARKILQDAGGLSELGHMSIPALKRIKGIGEAKAVSIAAAFQLGIRFLETGRQDLSMKVQSSRDIFQRYGQSLRLLNYEVFKILLLNSNNVIFKDIIISSGNLNASVVHSRDIFKEAIDHLAASVILMHNHPSGNPEASKQDIDITEKIVESGKIIGIPVLDHVIIGDNAYSSFADKGMI